VIAAVQNSVYRRQLAIAMATTTSFGGLGGAIGAALFGAIFTAPAGLTATGGDLRALGPAVGTDVIHGVQAVFLAAAPLAAVALLIVLLLREVPLQGGDPREAGRPAPGDRRASAPAPSRPALGRR
jgi:MFS family permease